MPTFTMIAFFAAVIGCGKTKEGSHNLAANEPGSGFGVNNPDPNDVEAVAAAKDTLAFLTIANGNTDPDKVTSDLSFPTSVDDGVTVSWVSNATTVTDSGEVSRPPFVSGDAAVVLTATFRRGFATDEKSLPLTVLRIPPTDVEAVIAAAAELKENDLLGANPSLTALIGPLTLPEQGAYETEVSWTSLNSALSAIGGVTRPINASGHQSGTLTATFSRGDASHQKEFSTTVLKLQDLLITEFSPGGYADDGWFEVLNTSDGELDLASFSWRACNWACTAASTGTFPSTTLEAGDYIIVHPANGIGSESGSSDVYLSGLQPNLVRGFFEITQGSTSVDFARWHKHDNSASEMSPISGQFEGSAAIESQMINPDPNNNSTLTTSGYSLARPYPMHDSDRDDDWSVFSHPSPGGTNGTGAAAGVDADGDGLTDEYETMISMTDPFKADTDGDWFTDGQEVNEDGVAGINISALGANPLVRDIFVEVDYMATPAGVTNSLTDTTEPNTVPLAVRRATLDKVAAVFQAYDPVAAGDSNPYPIRVHFDVGDLFDQSPGIDLDDYDLGGGNELPFYRCLYLGEDATHTPANCANLYKLKQDHFEVARRFVFHYFIVGWSQLPSGGVGSSGLAEIGGNDGIITMGSWNTLGGGDEQKIINYQSATLIHELGHNLGLNHGGHEPNNFKPNYISSMNYMYQLSGLDHDGDGDVFYYESKEPRGTHPKFTALDNPDSSANFVIGYSHGIFSTLDESALDEQLGWDSSNIDFNANNVFDVGTVQHNIQPPTASGNTSASDVHTDHNDWRNLNLRFQDLINSEWNGAPFPLTGNLDQQPLSPPCAPPSF